MLHLLKMLGPVGQDRVNVSLLLEREFERIGPAVEPDVHLDRPVDPLLLHEDGQGLFWSLAEKRHLRRLEHLVRKLVDVGNELHLVHLLDGGQCDLHGVQRPGVDGHAREGGPQLRRLDVAAEAHGLLPLPLLKVLVEELRVWHGHGNQVGSIGLSDDAVRAVEGDDLRVLPCVRAHLRLQGLGQQVLVHEDDRGIDESHELLVNKSDEHVCGVVPHEGVNHGAELLNLGRVHGLGEIKVFVLVKDGNTSVGPGALLVEGDPHNVELVHDRLAQRAPREDIEDADLLGRGGVDEADRVAADAERGMVQELRLQAAELDRRQRPALVVDDLDAVAVDESEVEGALHDQGGWLLEVLDMGSVPITLLVDIALVVRGDDQGAKSKRHVRDAVSEVQLLLGLVQDVLNRDGVVLVQQHICVLPRETSFHQARKHDSSAPAAAGELRSVVAPGYRKDRADVGRLAAV
mmetsp:Transcript_91519/g.262088  ORF Transcript_91519/g.262088 Transcript_91519/m.262088 type:complete len:462 (+) Transcript_91519:224-1609(+)